MTERMVKVQNMVNKTIVIRKPEYNLNRRWTQKNQIIPIPFDTLEQALWNEGIRTLFDRGMLYIPDMQDKIDLDLEPADATEPQNIIVLTDKQIENLLDNYHEKKNVTEIASLIGTKYKRIDFINKSLIDAFENEISISFSTYGKSIKQLFIPTNLPKKILTQI